MSDNSRKRGEVEGLDGVKFKFETGEDHKTVLSNHTWGGFRNGGLFELNFMLERKPIPEEVKNEIDESGIGDEIEREEPEGFIRENKVTVYMSLQSLLAHYNWLEKKVEELKEANIIQEGE